MRQRCEVVRDPLGAGSLVAEVELGPDRPGVFGEGLPGEIRIPPSPLGHRANQHPQDEEICGQGRCYGRVLDLQQKGFASEALRPVDLGYRTGGDGGVIDFSKDLVGGSAQLSTQQVLNFGPRNGLHPVPQVGEGRAFLRTEPIVTQGQKLARLRESAAQAREDLGEFVPRLHPER